MCDVMNLRQTSSYMSQILGHMSLFDNWYWAQTRWELSWQKRRENLVLTNRSPIGHDQSVTDWSMLRWCGVWAHWCCIWQVLKTSISVVFGNIKVWRRPYQQCAFAFWFCAFWNTTVGPIPMREIISVATTPHMNPQIILPKFCGLTQSTPQVKLCPRHQSATDWSKTNRSPIGLYYIADRNQSQQSMKNQIHTSMNCVGTSDCATHSSASEDHLDTCQIAGILWPSQDQSVTDWFQTNRSPIGL